MTDSSHIRAVLGSAERTGPWSVPPRFRVDVALGSCELDLREATLVDDTATIELSVTLGSVEILVPPHLSVDLAVDAWLGSVDEPRRRAAERGPASIRIQGAVRLGSCEVLRLLPGESPTHAERHARHEARLARRAEQRAHHLAWRQRHAHRRAHASSRLRRHVLFALLLALSGGIAIGWRVANDGRWWWLGLAIPALFALSGAITWRLTSPLLVAIRAARDIGDGKLDTRIDPRAHGGEVRLLATAINDMAEKIQRQLAEQRELLAAVSHELRTPLGHMRVLIETARERGDLSALGELESEVLVLDDLVGRLLASSRLEFGNLDRRSLDLGALACEVAAASGVTSEHVETIGELRAPVDPTLVRRAIANLLDNARVHGHGATWVRVERRGPLIAIEVEDAGPGVPADRRGDAFRAFVPSRAGGLGLGLALVSRIAVAHGGGAWIEDRPGGGARVGFSVEA